MEDRFIAPGIFKTCDPAGKTMYVIPGAPTSAMGKYQGIYDLIEDPSAYMRRQPGALASANADSIAILKQNAVLNRSRDMQDWGDLWGKESGKTCVFVSCGPSLTESVEEIKELSERDDVFTIGVNRAFKAIDLDYFVVIDRRAQDDWIDRDTGKTKLIACTTAANHICKEFPKEKRYFGESFLGGVDEGMTPIRTGLCITVCDALMAAYKLGADKIILYGFDYTMGGVRMQDEYRLDKYYYDLPSYVGLGIRSNDYRELQPITIDEKLGFINYELMAYACYTTAILCMIEESGGVEIENRTPGGLIFWGKR